MFRNRKWSLGIALVVVGLLAAACAAPVSSPPAVQTVVVPQTVVAEQTVIVPQTVIAQPTAEATPAAASETPTAGGQIVFAHSADPDTLDPHTTIAGTAWVVLANVYDGLVMLDYSSPDIPRPTIPGLAESYEVSEDGRTFTFKLREGVKFHDGSPWNAEAAVFNFRRWFDPEFEFYYPTANSTVSSFIGGVESYEALDEYTFEVTLAESNFGWLDYLSKAPTFFMVSPAAVQQYGNEEFALHGGGTGPFMIESYEKNNRLVLKKNPDYWGGAPNIDTLIFVPVPDDASRVAGLISGEFDIAHEISPDSIPEILANPNLHVELRGKPATFGLGGDMREGPWSDARVREAFSLAINRQAIAEKLLRGAGEPATQFFGLGNEGFDPTLPVMDPYDPEKAKALLQEAGYGDGFDIRMFTSTSAMGVPQPPRILEQVQRDLAEIGIRAEIVVMEWNAYLGMWVKGVPAAEGGVIPIYTQAMGWDTNQLLGAYVGSASQPPNGVNFVWYSNPEVDKLLAESRAAKSYDAMIQKLRDAQKLMLQDRPYVYIFHSKAPYAMNNRVHWVPAAAWAQNLRKAWVSQ